MHPLSCRAKQAWDADKLPDEPYYFSGGNELDFGTFPAHLPELTQTEQMMISKIHMFTQVRQVRGAQYRYKGHVVSFARNVAKVYKQLPLLPEDLEIVFIKPKNYADNPHFAMQRSREFKLRRSRIKDWLEFLQLNHPGYRDIQIDYNAINDLPNDDTIANRIPALEEDDAPDTGLNEEDAEQFVDDPVIGGVPDLQQQDLEIDQLREEMRIQRNEQRRREGCVEIEAPTCRATPLDEFDRSQPLFSVAFPYLFPKGQADFHTPCQRSIKLAEYIGHAVRYKDGRFAKHPTFTFIANNMVMRSQVRSKSTFFVKRTANDPTAEWDIQEIREAFDTNNPQAFQMQESIVRACNHQGHSPVLDGQAE